MLLHHYQMDVPILAFHHLPLPTAHRLHRHHSHHLQGQSTTLHQWDIICHQVETFYLHRCTCMVLHLLIQFYLTSHFTTRIHHHHSLITLLLQLIMWQASIWRASYCYYWHFSLSGDHQTKVARFHIQYFLVFGTKEVHVQLALCSSTNITLAGCIWGQQYKWQVLWFSFSYFWRRNLKEKKHFLFFWVILPLKNFSYSPKTKKPNKWFWREDLVIFKYFMIAMAATSINAYKYKHIYQWGFIYQSAHNWPKFWRCHRKNKYNSNISCNGHK